MHAFIVSILQSFIHFYLPAPQAFQPRVPDLPLPLDQLLLRLPGSVKWHRCSSVPAAFWESPLSPAPPHPPWPPLLFPYPKLSVLSLPLTVCVALGKLA